MTPKNHLAVACLAVLLVGVCAAPPAAGHGPDTRSGPALASEREYEARRGDLTVGEVRPWPGVTVDNDAFVMEDFRLRGLGPHIELWVAADLVQASEECRTSNPRNLEITDAQVRLLVREFEDVIRPREGRLFGVPRPLDGSTAEPELMDPELPAGAFRGDGRRIVVLVDNFRFGGGFVDPFLTRVTGRNVLTLLAQGWSTSLGRKPADFFPDDCRNLNGAASPSFKEAVLAHEYNHLTRLNRVGFSAPWLDEGIATFAQSLTGYVDPARPYVSNLLIGCFQGRQAEYLPQPWPDPFGHQLGGPENSLTAFGDQGQGSDCDYGPQQTLMLFLAERYGDEFIGDLFRTSGGSGLADGLAPTLRRHRSAQDVAQTLQDWSTTVALDGVLDDGATLTGAQRKRFSVRALRSTVNLDTPFAYASPGAPPNGADFVRLRGGGGRSIETSALRTLTFQAPKTYAPDPVEWTVDDGALSSGAGDGLDRSIVRSITVDPANPVLSFDARHDIEPEYDFGFVQVSTDGGRTYRSRAATTTTTAAAADAESRITDQLPGFNGDSGGWVHQTVDLSDVAGRQVLIAFRYMTDAFGTNPGLWIDDVRSGATLVSDGTSLTGWQTMTEIQPVAVAGVGVRLVAYDDRHRRAAVADLRLDGSNQGGLTQAQLDLLRSARAETVLAIVSHYEPTEAITAPARYRLTVNGRLQPGG